MFSLKVENQSYTKCLGELLRGLVVFLFSFFRVIRLVRFCTCLSECVVELLLVAPPVMQVFICWPILPVVFCNYHSSCWQTGRLKDIKLPDLPNFVGISGLFIACAVVLLAAFLLFLFCCSLVQPRKSHFPIFWMTTHLILICWW